jgi:membrane protein YqaA with SNARE-associated domain
MHRLSTFFQRVGSLIQAVAENLGAPGLALVAFFDSSFVSLPEVADALLVVAVVHEPSLWLYYAAATTAGSVAGCYALYAVARKGGDAFLRKRFRADRIERGLGLFKRYGLLAVVVPSILPPPTPFKIFVLLAGVARVSPATFLFAVTIGRGIRYGGEAWLAYEYGERAFEFIRHNVPIVSAWVGGLVAVAGIGAILWRNRQKLRT